MSSHSSTKRLTVPRVRSRKGAKPLVCLTAYTAPMARILDPLVDIILVGDSLGMVIYGLDNTIPVPLDYMINHGAAVSRGTSRAMVVVDLPFGSYEASFEQAFQSAARVMKETGCAAVKLEGGVSMAPTVKFLTERGIPVVGHIGLQPQHCQQLGGFKAQGRDRDDWEHIKKDAVGIEHAGAFAIVLEGIAEPLGVEITEMVSVPTIGIGASASCDGQILVTEDMLGLFAKTPTFVKKYAKMELVIAKAVADYASDVRDRQFPAEENTYSLR